MPRPPGNHWSCAACRYDHRTERITPCVDHGRSRASPPWPEYGEPAFAPYDYVPASETVRLRAVRRSPAETPASRPPASRPHGMDFEDGG